MQTLREKWENALPIILGIFLTLVLITGATVLITYLINWATKPDPRTPTEIIIDKYKTCITYADAEKLNKCEIYIDYIKNNIQNNEQQE